MIAETSALLDRLKMAYQSPIAAPRVVGFDYSFSRCVEVVLTRRSRKQVR